MGLDKVKIIAVVGPTAVGKTALGIELAKRFNGEIKSRVSRKINKDERTIREKK